MEPVNGCYMNTRSLQEKFERMGARLKIGPGVRRRWELAVREISLDILKDHKGEYFELTTDPARTFRVDALDVRPKDRHLLLMVAAERDAAHPFAGEKQKFLCGHDERSWFVAAVAVRPTVRRAVGSKSRLPRHAAQRDGLRERTRLASRS